MGTISRRFGLEKNEMDKPQRVSFTRLVKMAAPDWMYGVLGTLGAIFAGAQMPLFALGITQGMVSLYSADYNYTKSEIRKICLLFCTAAVLTVFAHLVEYINFAIMGERLTLRVREMMFAGENYIPK